ncbi:hypothetical protein U879_16110 [Defluviimonas sp. 20V17]|uniref:Uncharacterized protein n=2 Tax=Allgaiera indica TaxID=765699 RepID=A0AAN4US29_9RHOB|nr:hypothetical protein U879_16110 [Defluviimonas sp. 20V17]GHE01738.1 hypothetical protein GCM10008024_18650 [Allgaiera indica]SDW94007.1 hypothetical protein SAMN05444006_10881 [Allgaiera indica]
MTSNIAVLRLEEQVQIDPARFEKLCARHGTSCAENLMARVVGELALVLSAMVGQYSEGNLKGFARGLRNLRRLADEVGMQTLSRATEGVRVSLRRGDSTALAATWARCLRLGEQSLLSDWDARDLSG